MLGINGAEFLVLIVIALLVVGPERLPGYAEQLASWVRTLRRYASTARERVATELGEEAADVDWASLDPRRYDPRRIVRDALLEDVTAPVSRPGAAAGAAAAGGLAGGAGATAAAARQARAGVDAPAEAGRAPFDDEAT